MTTIDPSRADPFVSIPSFRDLGYLHEVTKPVSREYDELLEDVTGQLPEELVGTLYRNGPGRWPAGQPVHAFDGDGMVTRLTFGGGSIRYTNRYVRTPAYIAGQRGDETRGIGTQRTGGAWANAFRLPASRANTHAVIHGERLLALADSGRPFEVDPDTLETVGPCDFHGRLPRTSAFSPHPKLDPHSGEMFNFGTLPMLRPGARRFGLRCYRAGADGRLNTVATIGLDHLGLNHDFAITERYLAFVLAPLLIDGRDLASALCGRTTFERAVDFRTELGTRIVLVPRDGGKPRVLEHPAIPYVHFNNAYDDGGDVVADIVRYEDYEMFMAAVRDVRSLSYIPAGRPARMRITPNGRVTVDDLCDVLGEFPQHDWRRTSRPYRYSYCSGYTGDSTAIIKIDNETGAHNFHSFAAGHGPGEALFVPRSTTSGEDDGWLLVLVVLSHEQRTALFVLDARNIEADPVVVARLPHYAFPGFHGMFTRRIPRLCAPVR